MSTRNFSVSSGPVIPVGQAPRPPAPLLPNDAICVIYLKSKKKLKIGTFLKPNHERRTQILREKKLKTKLINVFPVEF